MTDEPKKTYGVPVKADRQPRLQEEPSPGWIAWALAAILTLFTLAILAPIAIGGIARLWKWAL